jgi:hypothetical protein
MDKARDQQLQEYTELLHLKDKVEKDLLNIPGVVAVSVGLKVIEGFHTEEMCLRIYVDEKKPLEAIPEAYRIPPSIDGVATDVNEVSHDVSASAAVKADTAEYRPLCGGIAIRSANSKGRQVGTLGCMVLDEAEGDVFLLTNAHVLLANGESKGHDVGQPDFCCEPCPCRCGEVAKLERWGDYETDNVDCAIALLTSDQQSNWNNEVLELGAIRTIRLDENGTPVHPITGLPTFNGQPYKPVIAKDTVFKRGISTRLTEGIVVDPAAPATVGIPTKDGEVSISFTNQILIHPKKNVNEAFVSKGDSGAVVVNHLNEVIGLHFADNEVRNEENVVTKKATKSFANPIQDVLKVLQVSIPDTGTFQTLPLESGNGSAPPNKDLLQKLTEKIESQPDGAVFIDTVNKYKEEVADLIRRDREVKVAWNRYQGPAFLAHLLQKAKDPAYVVPTEIETVSYQRLLLKMSVVLERKGSSELASDIERYSVRALALIERLISSDARMSEL